MKIIIVDDETHALHTLQECLEELRPSAEVIPFDRSDKALEYAHNNGTLDVAFLDIHMPVMNGIELAKELKKICPNVNVVFCTAFSEHVMEAMRLHASGYVTKPYNRADIARELDNLLHPVDKEMPAVFARTFGNFDLFVDNVAVTFKRAKSKELLAYLIYKKGGMISKKELAAVLFEDDYTVQKQNYVSKLYSDLVKDLKNVGIESLLCKGFNQYGVDLRAFDCDYYDYQVGNPAAINAFSGEFFAQYEWAML